MRKLLNENHGVVQYLISAIAGLIAVIIGVLIWFKTDGALVNGFGSRAGTGTSYAGFNSTITSINTSANSIWTLFPIVAIVVIAAIILMVIMAFGGQRGGT